MLLAVYKFLSVFVGALILFTLCKPIHDKMIRKWKIKPNLSALIIILFTIVIILIPLIFITTLAVDQIIILSQNSDEIVTSFNQLISSINDRFPELNLQERIDNLVKDAISYLGGLITSLVESTANIIISAILMYFLLYFLLTDSEKWKQKTYEFLPFNQADSKRILEEFVNVTNSTIIGSGIIAVIQGCLLGIAFWFVGIKSAVIWGIVGTILSFIPMFGTPFLWIPAVIYLLITGEIVKAIGLLIFSALVIGNIDNVLRLIINKKIGNIHPLTSLFGVFFGLYLFGIMGIILGPLLISYFFLLVDMYRREYGDAPESL